MTGRAGAAVLLSALLAAAPALGQCRLALALALDVSSSVDPREYDLQKQGLASALEDEEVRGALITPGAPVALAVYEWSAEYNPVDRVGWTVILDDATLDGIVARLRALPRSSRDQPTALGRALAYGSLLLARSPPCQKKTLDVSGDGENNHDYPPASAYRHFDFEKVTVNGLAIGGRMQPQLVDYYRDEVIRGPGAFVEVAESYADFADAMKRKLLREARLELAAGTGR